MIPATYGHVIIFFIPDRRPEQCGERALLVWSPTTDIPDYKCE